MRSVDSSIPYLAAKASAYLLPSRHFLTLSGIESAHSLTSFRILEASVALARAESCRKVPIKATVVLAVLSSTHARIVWGSVKPFCSKFPFKVC